MRRADKPMSTPMKIAFWFIAANALAGALSLILFPTRTDALFFWTIRPAINAALFGALYLGGAAIVAWVTYRGVWESARFLIPILVSAGILISVTTLLHVDRFEPGFKLLYWLLVYIGAPLLALFFYVQHERRGANWTAREPVTPATRGIAVALGSILLLAGVAVLIWPGGVVANWPWPTTPLMVRIFASWFSAFGVGLLWFRLEPDWGRLRHVANLMIAASGLDLLMLLIHRDDLTGGGMSLWVYCVHLAAFGLLGLLMHWLQRTRSSASGRPRSASAAQASNWRDTPGGDIRMISPSTHSARVLPSSQSWNSSKLTGPAGSGRCSPRTCFERVGHDVLRGGEIRCRVIVAGRRA